MTTTRTKETKRTARRARIRSRVAGTSERPRLAIFRSNRFVYAQLINDDNGATVAAVDSRKAEGANATERAVWVGKEIASRAKAAGVTAVVFDRGGYRYQGAIAALADAAREGGLTF